MATNNNFTVTGIVAVDANVKNNNAAFILPENMPTTPISAHKTKSILLTV